MILKPPDAKNAAISELEKLFRTADKDKQAAIARELRIMRTDLKSESESAFLINFYLRSSQNTIVIHDLRLKLDDGRVAHIDHLLIDRSYRFYILETRHYSHGVKINDQGEFLRWNDWKQDFEHTLSPIEQNKRHSAVLQQTLKSLGLYEPDIQSFVLIAPYAHIDHRKRSDTADAEWIVKADQFLTELNENLENVSFLRLLAGSVKTTMTISIFDIAQKLIALHRPAAISYANKIWLSKFSPSRKIPERQFQ